MATKSHSRLVMEELLTALRANHANFNLSTVNGTYRVVVDAAQPPVTKGPWVVLQSPWPIEDEPDAVTPLTQDKVSGTIRFWAFAPSTQDNSETRSFAAQDLARDVRLAIKTAHADDSYDTLFHLESLRVRIDLISGDASVKGLPYGVVQGSILYEGFTEGGS